MLWTEKHRPDSIKGVLGNNKAIMRLLSWAQDWQKGIPSKRALVLSGAPGCGKTTAALALAREMLWDVVELNASDLRNAEGIERILGRASVNRGFADGRYLSTESGHKRLIMFDEADNLFGRVDYGGAGAIVKVVEATRQPIILIVNDYYELVRRSPRLRDLADEVKFFSVRRETIAKRLFEISKIEGVRVDARVIDRIAESARGDLRAAINDLEALAEGQASVGADELVDARDMFESEFDVTRMILETSSVKKAREAFNRLDVEPETFMLWLEENVPIAYRDPESLNAAFEALSRTSLFFARVIRRQSYGLWAYAISMMTGGVAVAKKGPSYLGGQRLNFPRWLRKRQGKQVARLTLASMFGKMTHLSAVRTRVDMMPYYLDIMRRDPRFVEFLYDSAALEEEVEALNTLTGGRPSPKKDDGEGEEGRVGKEISLSQPEPEKKEPKGSTQQELTKYE